MALAFHAFLDIPRMLTAVTLYGQALPSCVSDDYPAQYEVVTAGEYVKSRLEATYAHSKIEQKPGEKK